MILENRQHRVNTVMLIDDEPDINAALTVVISILLPEVYISRQSEMSSVDFPEHFLLQNTF